MYMLVITEFFIVSSSRMAMSFERLVECYMSIPEARDLSVLPLLFEQ